MPVPAGPSPVVYIAGAGRSGSTLVERLLGSADGWVNVGELAGVFLSGVLRDERCGCGEPFAACSFWTAVGDRAFGGWDPAQAERLVAIRRGSIRQRHATAVLRDPRTASPDQRTYADTFAALYAAIAAETGARVLVDASKEAVPALYVSRLADVDLRPLQLVRDPRGVAYSWTKADVARPNAEGRTMRVYSPLASAKAWNRDNVWGSVLRRRSPHQALLRYDAFCDDPAGSLARAVRRLGLDPVELPLEGHRFALERTHALGGNPNRFQDNGTVGPDLTWRRALPGPDRWKVAAATLPVRAALRLDDRHPEGRP